MRIILDSASAILIIASIFGLGRGNFAIGSAMTILALSFWSVLLPSGFRIFSFALVSLGLIAFLFKSKSLIRQIHLSMPRTNLVYWGIITAFVFRLVYLALFKPVIDPDVINYYLPFARSLVLADHVPAQNFFNSLPIIHTPIGSLVLPALSYIVSNSTTSEAFRLLNLPFIIGILFVSYRFLFTLTKSKTFALQSLAILVSLPLMDSLLFEALFYPDFIFTFFCLLSLEGLYRLNTHVNPSLKDYLKPSLYLALTLLIKFQAIFIIPFFAAYLFFASPIRTLFKKTVAFCLVFALIYSRLFHAGTLPAPHPALLLMLPFILLWFFWQVHISKPHFRPKPVHLLAFIITVSVGSLWFIRNQLIYGNYLIRLTDSDLWSYTLQSVIAQENNLYPVTVGKTTSALLTFVGISPQNFSQPALSSFALFFWPSLGSFWIIFKIIGLLKARASSLFFATGWVVYWYFIWIYYLGAVSDRHLLPILPLLAALIALGVNTIFKTPQKASLAIVTISFASLLQSRFLSWNLGVALIGRARLKELAETAFESVNTVKAISTPPIDYFKTLLSALNAPSETANHYLFSILAFSVVITVIAVYLRLRLAKPFLVTFGAMFIPYLLTVLMVTNFKPQHFTIIEQNKVYSYAGQFEAVIPILKNRLTSEDQVIFIGPPTGLAYYLNHPVLDFMNTSDVSIFMPIYDSTDTARIDDLLSAQHIRYLVVSADPLTQKKLTTLKRKSFFFRYLFDSSLSESIGVPTAYSSWYTFALNPKRI